MEKAIQKAVEAGWISNRYLPCAPNKSLFSEHAILDPLFWQALGKAENWTCCKDIPKGDKRCEHCDTPWKAHWHHFIDHLAEGKPIDDFFNNLLSK